MACDWRRCFSFKSGAHRAFLGDPRFRFDYPSWNGVPRFDYKWNNAGDGDCLTLQFGGDLLFESEGVFFEGSESRNSGLIFVGDLAGRTDNMRFTLNSQGEVNA